MNYHIKKTIKKPLALLKKSNSCQHEVIRSARKKYHLHNEFGEVKPIEYLFRSYKKCIVIFLTVFAALIVGITSYCNYLLGTIKLRMLFSVVHSVTYSIFILMLSKHIISQIVLIGGRYQEKDGVRIKEKCLNFSWVAPISYARQFDKKNAVLIRKDGGIYELHYLAHVQRLRFYGGNSTIKSNNISFAVIAVILLAATIIDSVLVFLSHKLFPRSYIAFLAVFLGLSLIGFFALLGFLFHKSSIRYEEKNK